MAEAYAESEPRQVVESPGVSVVRSSYTPSVTVPGRPSRGVFASLRDRQLLDILAAGEFFLVTGSAILAKILYIDAYLGMARDTLPYATIGALVAAAYCALMRRRDGYSATRMDLPHALFRKMTVSLLTAFAVMLVAGYAMKVSDDYSRVWVLTWVAMSLVSLVIYAVATALLLRRLVSQGRFSTKVAFISERGYGGDVGERLRRDQRTNLCVALAYDPVYAGDVPVDQAGIDRFVELAQMQDVDRIVIAIPPYRSETANYLLERLEPVSAELALYSELLSRNRREVSVVQNGAMDLFAVRAKPLTPWAYMAKSVFDRVAAGLLLMLLALPMALIALAIRYESPGKALFEQRRHGLNNRIIRVLKFRTMRVLEDGDEIVQATKDDERVTRLGRFLRRTSLDELPQLYNVLRGEMSLVGPRPHALAHNFQYTKQLVRYANRHRVKPGITGWAQINGFRGATEDPLAMKSRVEHDLYYIDNWSFWLDLKILLLTPIHVLIGKNAY